MRKQQDGFSLPHILLVLVLVGIIGFAGWRVYESQKATNKSLDNAANASNVVKPGEKQAAEEYKVPEGYTVYENKNLGFKFAYPEKWGQLQDKSGKFESSQISDGYIAGTLKISSSPIGNFVFEPVSKGAVVKAEVTGNDVAWKVSDPNTESEKYKAGDLYSAPKVIFERNSLKVYDFPNAHATASWRKFVFKVGDNFILIETPSSAPAVAGQTQAEFDALVAKDQAVFDQIGKSIRIL
jgi:type II secretory pathway pseudopilin PulG